MRSVRARAVAPVVLGALPLVAGCRPAPAWHAVSPDHGTRVLVREGRGGTCVTVAARAPHARRCHDAVNVSGLAFARRGGSVAYAARDGDRWRVFHDGRASAAWAGVGPPVLSADGARLAHAASDGVAWRVIVDGIRGAPFDSVVAGSIGFDDAARRVAYAAWRGDSAHVVIDGIAGRGWRAVDRLGFAPGSGPVAWVGALGDRHHLVVGDSAGPANLAVGEIAWTRAGDRLAYAARADHGWHVVAGTWRSEPYGEVRALAWLGTGDEASPAFVARAGAREAVVVRGAPHAWHGRVGALVVTRGGRWGYVADGEQVLVDGRPLAIERLVTELAIADDGSRHAYLAAAGDTMLVVDDRGRHRFDLVVDGTLQFVDGTSAWACIAGDRARRTLFVVVDGRRTTRRLDWAELVRLTQRHGERADVALRDWVAAEARLALAQRPP